MLEHLLLTLKLSDRLDSWKIEDSKRAACSWALGLRSATIRCLSLRRCHRSYPISCGIIPLASYALAEGADRSYFAWVIEHLRCLQFAVWPAPGNGSRPRPIQERVGYLWEDFSNDRLPKATRENHPSSLPEEFGLGQVAEPTRLLPIQFACKAQPQ